MKKRTPSRGPLYEVRHSPVHGFGVFARRRIRSGTNVLEYLGDRISHEEADTRYEEKSADDNHTFLFTVNDKIVIDAGVNGNEARYVNHGCDPNCQSVTINQRIFIEAIRTIQPGEELHYDYQIQRDPDDAANVDAVFACRCGAAECRGTMLEPVKVPRRKPQRRSKKPAGKARNATGKARNAAKKAAARRRVR